jgi:hypothetical protein
MPTIQRVPDTATHYARVTTEGEPDMAICLREAPEAPSCEDCGRTDLRPLWQPLDQEGGPGPVCPSCLADADWAGPFPLPLPIDLPTHLPFDA